MTISLGVPDHKARRSPDWIVGTDKGEWRAAWDRYAALNASDGAAYRRAELAYYDLCRRRRETWMQQAGVKECTAQRCLGKVVLGAGHKSCYAYWGACEYQDFMSRFHFSIFDHTKIFFHPKSRTYVFISQPYNLTRQHVDMLQEWCRDRGLVVDVLPHAGWHHPSAPLVVIRRKEAQSE
jgi:hypothetical protein